MSIFLTCFEKYMGLKPLVRGSANIDPISMYSTVMSHFFIRFLIIKYFNSIIENKLSLHSRKTIIICLILLQNTTPSANIKVYFEINFKSSGHSARSESKYPSNYRSLILLYTSIWSLIFCKYLITLFAVIQY